jgi:hypothetical protein
MQFLHAYTPNFCTNSSVSDAPINGQRHGLSARLLAYANRPWLTGLASFVATGIILLPAEYEMPIRSLMLFLSSRRF